MTIAALLLLILAAPICGAGPVTITAEYVKVAPGVHCETLDPDDHACRLNIGAMTCVAACERWTDLPECDGTFMYEDRCP